MTPGKPARVTPYREEDLVNRLLDSTWTKRVLIKGMMIAMIGLLTPSWVVANEHMIIAASPSLAALLNALGHAFEDKHPGVKVQLFYGTGLELRQAIATMENRNRSQYFIGSGPMHLIAPGGDEVITRLEARQYAQARTPYATESLVLVVPESLVEAPASFEALAQDVHIRIAVADPKLTVLGQKTQEFLQVLGGPEAWKGRVDVATHGSAFAASVQNALCAFCTHHGCFDLSADDGRPARRYLVATDHLAGHWHVSLFLLRAASQPSADSGSRGRTEAHPHHGGLRRFKRSIIFEPGIVRLEPGISSGGNMPSLPPG